jgi:hypothetical protein
MLDAGGGGSSGTNWNAIDMATMWRALETQETTSHWKLLTGWQTSYELTYQHLTDVKRYRENLATAWPPEKSPAAAAYLERLDTLITHLQGTYDAAVANHTAFSAATAALADTRYKLKKLYDEYAANQSKIDAHNAEMAERAAKAGPKGSGMSQPPVSADRQEQLTWQARSLMFGLSSEVTQAHTSITKPPVYVPEETVAQDRHKRGGTTYVPPVLPPLFTPESQPRPSGSGLPNSVATGPNAPTYSPATHGPGLVLGGTSPTPITLPGNPGPGIITQPPVNSPATNLVNPAIGLPGVPGTGGLPPSSASPNTYSGGALMKPGAGGTSTGTVRAMPVGGIIGGVPGAGLGQPGAGSRAAQRINPVGGVISPNGASGRSGSPSRIGAARPVGMPGDGVGAIGGVGGRAGSHQSVREEASRWDPGNPWETDEGVVPVVLPPAEQRVDPGPAIGFRR